MTDHHSSLPRAEFGFPGPLRDKLVNAILVGAKTATTSLLADYESDGEPLPVVGNRYVVIDSDERPVAVIRLTDVQIVPLTEVGWEHVRDEGEGYRSVAEWRGGHEEFWESDEVRESLGDPGLTVNNNTLVVAERFRVIALL
ncbi:ASCH domain-containing protein [Streptomyces sp. NPDC054796]